MIFVLYLFLGPYDQVIIILRTLWYLLFIIIIMRSRPSKLQFYENAMNKQKMPPIINTNVFIKNVFCITISVILKHITVL